MSQTQIHNQDVPDDELAGIKLKPGDRFVWTGTWSSLTSYVVGDVVMSAGSTYRANAASLNDVPPSGNWDAIGSGGGGATGVTGATGPTGASGSGTTGVTGVSGVDGLDGPPGSPGATGVSGATGGAGTTGAGVTGATGVPGLDGLDGNASAAGGATGATGVTGVTGVTGATGSGATGVTGATGVSGPAGLDGIDAQNVGLSPGYEFGYDQITAPVTVSAVTVAGTTVISCAAHTFDGGPVIATFFAPMLGSGDVILIRLFEGATNLGRLYETHIGDNIGGVTGILRFTPTAGSHTYTVTAQRSAANGTVYAGVPVGDDLVPAFIRFTKA